MLLVTRQDRTEKRAELGLGRGAKVHMRLAFISTSVRLMGSQLRSVNNLNIKFM